MIDLLYKMHLAISFVMIPVFLLVALRKAFYALRYRYCYHKYRMVEFRAWLMEHKYVAIPRSRIIHIFRTNDYFMIWHLKNVFWQQFLDYERRQLEEDRLLKDAQRAY